MHRSYVFITQLPAILGCQLSAWLSEVYLLSAGHVYKQDTDFPANKLRKKYVVISSKRRFDVIITYLLRIMFAG